MGVLHDPVVTVVIFGHSKHSRK